jgi:hypothetical protein
MASHGYRLGHAKGTLFGGVYFTEATPAEGTTLGSCIARSDVQNTNLETLKKSLAQQVHAQGGNVLAAFTYVQRANFFSFSSVSWEAKGIAMKLDESLITSTAVIADDAATKASDDLKACPYCGEEIKKVAIKCKHCGSSL